MIDGFSYTTAEAYEISRALARFDAVADRAVRWAAPVQFRLAQSAPEREAVYRMRYRVVIEKGWGAAADFPNGLERDAYDERAVQIVGWDNDKIVASGRLVFPVLGQVLPTEETFGLEIEPRGQVVDLGRTIVLNQYSNISHRVLAGLLAQSWIETRRRGHFNVCATFSEGMTRLCRRIGVHFTSLSPPRRYWREDRIAVRLDVLASAQALTERWAIKASETEGS